MLLRSIMTFNSLLSNFSILLSLILSISYLFLKKKNSPLIFISFLWILAGLLQFQLYLIYTKELLNYPEAFIVFFPTTLLIGPFFYFYFESKSSTTFKLKGYQLFHFLPSILSLVIFREFIFGFRDEKIQTLHSLYNGLHMFGYLTLSILTCLSTLSYIIYITKQQRYVAEFKSLFSRNLFYLFAFINLTLPLM